MSKFVYMFFIGLFLLASGFATSLIQGKNDMVSMLPISIGAFLIVAYLFLDLKNVFNFLNSKGFKYGSNSILMSIIFLAILVILQVIVSGKKVQFDVTENKQFTLADQTNKIIDNLDEKVRILAFVQNGTPAEAQAKDLLKQFTSKTNKVVYEIIDPNREPSKAKQYEIKQFNTLLILKGEKKEKTNDLSEESVTNALIKITRDEQKTIYFLKGHGEKSFSDTEPNGISYFKEQLEKQSYAVKEAFLLTQSSVPEDATLLIIPGLQKPLFDNEKAIIEDYIRKGGSVIFMADPELPNEMIPFIEKFGIKIQNDIIIDKVSKLFGGDYSMPLILKYEKNPITKSLSAASIFPYSTSLKAIDKENFKTQIVLKTTPESWGETNKELLIKSGQARLDPTDNKGPLSLSMLSTIEVNNPENKKSDKPKKGKLLVFGDSDFTINQYISQSGNIDLLLNSINWLAEEEDLIAIKAKNKENTPLILNQTQGRLIFWINLLFIPLSVALFGTFYLTKRKRATQ